MVNNISVGQPFLVNEITCQLRLNERWNAVNLYKVSNQELILIFQPNGEVFGQFGKVGDLYIEPSGWVLYANSLRTRFLLQTKNVFEAYQKVAVQYLQSLSIKPVQTAELPEEGGPP